MINLQKKEEIKELCERLATVGYEIKRKPIRDGVVYRWSTKDHFAQLVVKDEEDMELLKERLEAQFITSTREVFEKAIKEESRPERIARLEVLREYFTNPEFREYLSNESFNQTYKEPQR